MTALHPGWPNASQIDQLAKHSIWWISHSTGLEYTLKTAAILLGWTSPVRVDVEILNDRDGLEYAEDIEIINLSWLDLIRGPLSFAIFTRLEHHEIAHFVGLRAADEHQDLILDRWSRLERRVKRLKAGCEPGSWLPLASGVA